MFRQSWKYENKDEIRTKKDQMGMKASRKYE